MDKYFKLLNDLYPLHRTLVSDDTDKAYEMILTVVKKMGLSGDNILLHEFPSGSELSTWITPKKYNLKNYYLSEIKGKRENKLITKKEIPLSIAEYSHAVDRILTWDEIRSHLFHSDKRPQDIPFVVKYLYKDNFGFCLPKIKFEKINPSSKFRAVIESEFTNDRLKCLEIVLPGKKEESVLSIANICHPYQVNDSITGVINSLLLIEKFMKKKHNFTLRFGFWPETIGAQAYFTKYHRRKSMFKYAIFTEMLGTSGKHALQFSRQNNTLLDRAAEYVLKQMNLPYYTGRYLSVLRNDERIANGPNLDIPTVSLSRWPYAEYHTSADTPAIVNMRNIKTSSEATAMILDIIDSDRVLYPSFFGQPFLTRFDLFYDPLESPDLEKLNKMQEDIYSYSDGKTSLFDIAERLNYKWNNLIEEARKLKQAGLFRYRRDKQL
ncbi:MAG: DUF4910 domain-containing protein [Candidatus Omnitrophica bacterium]|nr:DUF4910 domain-containing protein [Candidatus Omnitrophota bacterium]